MPVFRCAYCHQTLGDTPPRGPCPSCGRRMLVPEDVQEVPFRDRLRGGLRQDRASDSSPEKTSPAADVAQAMARHNPVVVIVVLGVLLTAGVALVGRSCGVPGMDAGREDRARTTAICELAAIRGGLEGFRTDCGTYPDESNGLTSLVLKLGNPKWDGPYVNLLRSDPWRHPYLYRLDGTGFVLKSLGPDGMESTDDVVVGTDWTNFVDLAPGAQPRTVK